MSRLNPFSRRLLRTGLAAVMAVFALFTVSVVVPAAAQSAAAGAQMRFIHALPGGSPVDVYIDSQLAASKLSYGQATGFLNVSLAAHAVAVVASGQSASATPIVAANVTPERGASALLIVVDGTADKPEVSVIKQDLSPVAAGKTRFTAVHAIKDAPAIDVLRPDGTPILQSLQYGATFGGFDAPASAPGLAVVPAGGQVSGAVLQIDSLPLDAGTVNDLVVLGTVSGAVKPSYLLLSTAAQPNSGDVLVRYVNGATAGKAFDLYVNGTLVAPDLAFGDATVHLPIAKGSQKIDLRNVGDAVSVKPIASQTITAGDPAQTVVITAKAGQLAATASTDNVAGLDPKSARLTLIDSTGANTSFTLRDQKGTSSTKPAGQSVDLPSGQYDVSAGNATANQVLNGGTLTDLILTGASDSPKLVIADTEISAQPGSPFDLNAASAQATASAQPPATSTPTVVAAAPTTAATAVATQPAAAQVSATATTVGKATTNAKTPTQVQPTATDTLTAGPTQPSAILATVATNPGVNLKIRQYPLPDSYTMFLAPSGSDLYILGVIGPSTTTGTPTTTATATPTGEPGIWVFVSFTTPDGGTVTGWTLSNYLSISVNGTPILSDKIAQVKGIQVISSDTPGTGGNLTPVALTNVITGKVITKPGINAKLHSIPDVTGESLALVPSGSTVTVLGQTTSSATPIVGSPASSVWYFVRYDVSGSSIFGWMSADNLYVTFRTKPVPTGQVPTQLTITPGYIVGSSVTQLAPTVVPGLVVTVANLVGTANLTIRAQPNIAAGSLDKVPNGTVMQALGRNGDGSWVQVQYNGQTGWVNSGFVILTHSGAPVSIGILKITNGDPNTFGQTPSPSATAVG